MIRRSRPISGGASSTRAKPAFFEMLSSSAKVYPSPAGVVASIIMLKAAAVGGVKRSGLGTSSAIAARPPGFSAACTLPEEKKHAGVQHRLFFAQVEFCDNLIFRRRAAVDALEQRLLDANRTIGQPNKLTLIFGRRITRHHAGKLQTVIEDMNLPNPVIRSHYRKGFLKQYVRDRLLLRTEPATNNISTDYGIGKAVESLPPLRQRLNGLIDRYLEVQQDILETFVDREEVKKLPRSQRGGRGFESPLVHQIPKDLHYSRRAERFSFCHATSASGNRSDCSSVL